MAAPSRAITSEYVQPKGVAAAIPGRRPIAATTARRSARGARFWWLVLIGLPLILINVFGAPYYFASMQERVRLPLHPWLRPSGYIGQSAGIIALLIFCVLWLYPLRKKFKKLAFLGSLGRWMDVHVASALALPLLLAIHSSWRSNGLIGLGLVAMLVVIASGVVGRYLYTRIPRARSGVELTRDEVAAKRRELIDLLVAATGLSPDVVDRTLDMAPSAMEHGSLARIIWHLLSDDLLRWKRTRELRQRWAAIAPAGRPLSRQALSDAVRYADQEISLAQQSRMLEATQRVFAFWHVAHRPFAITALLAVAVHVVVVVAVGATWF